ncbi:unnamed protein product [Psylliodes chrysocephalus]|uniref:Nucleic-acid-binding protein from transposon X-element n=1 Tax=Psylliodes chrysocephalus TaxID=3402493 RepID=A0A9P0CZD4_9CUCU|nr:unnamed protein product [Psylliodes chrysocephala]
MKEITQRSFSHAFYIKAPETMTRKTLSDLWDNLSTDSNEVILQTKVGFLIKSDQNKPNIIDNLKNSLKHILNYSETKPSTQTSVYNSNTSKNTYSVVIGSVEHDITDEELSSFLMNSNINHRYCKRITSKAINKPTYMIIIISGCLQSTEKILNEGVFYKHKHFPVYPSLPPAPIPQPCSRCQQFTHTRENCTTSIKCSKCNGPHHFSKCNTQLPQKCVGCGAEDHSAWSLKCPNRPTKLIQGIPNNLIKVLNKKSKEIDKKLPQAERLIQILQSMITFLIHISINLIRKKIHREKNSSENLEKDLLHNTI